MSATILSSPAKINLFLEITGTRSDDYHTLCSLVDLISLHDTIELTPAPRFTVSFESPWRIPPENSITKTVRLIESLASSKASLPRYALHITKRIPPGSGMGGGSSNAASVLKFFNTHWKLGLDQKNLFQRGATIGADVPLFLHGRQSIVTGIGETIHPLPNPFHLSYLIFVPPFEVSTKKVYESLSLQNYVNLTTARENITILLNFLWKNKITEAQCRMFNRLEEPSMRVRRELAATRTILQQTFHSPFFLTGTGGALFSIFPNDYLLPTSHPKEIKSWQRYAASSEPCTIDKEEFNGNN
jgi:4-diphosphocytidyl-2-C-methyl-D-erythritol kinase